MRVLMNKQKAAHIRQLPRLQAVDPAITEDDFAEILLLYGLCTGEEKHKFFRLRGNFQTKKGFLIAMVLGK